MPTRPHYRRRHLTLVQARQHEIATMCWGCKYSRRDPWEHDPSCPEWSKKVGCCSGT